MPDVFISYSRKDNSLVQQLFDALKGHNRTVWVDWEDIPVTADWWHEICSGIEASDTLIFVVSPHSLSSPVCNMELAHARSYHKRLVPIIAQQVDNKTSLESLSTHELDDNLRAMLNGRDILELANANWQAIARHNWLMFDQAEKFASSFPALIEAIETDLAYARQHTRLLLRAREWDNKGRDVSYVLVGTDLHDAERFLAQAVNQHPAITPLHADYVLASQQHAQAEHEKDRRLQQSTRRALQFLVGFMGALIGLLLFSVVITMDSFISVSAIIHDMSRELQDLTYHTLDVDGDTLSALVTLGLDDPATALQDARYQSLVDSLRQTHENFPNIVLSLDAREPETGYRIPLFYRSELNPAPEYFLPQQGNELNLGIEYNNSFITDSLGTYLTARKPIYDSSGQFVGLLTIDVLVSSNVGVLQNIVNYLGTLIVILIVLALMGISFVVFDIRRRMRRSSPKNTRKAAA